MVEIDYKGKKYSGMELEIGGKKFAFRDKFTAMDMIEIGLPLFDIERYRDPVTKDIKLTPGTLTGDDFKAIRLWKMRFFNRMNLNGINFEVFDDIETYAKIEADPRCQELTQRLMNAQQGPPVDKEKKS